MVEHFGVAMAKLWLIAATAVLLVNAAAEAQPEEGAPLVHAWPQLHTPDQITPAVLPYLACLYARRGLPALHASDGSAVAYDKSSADCSAARARAASDAVKLLDGKPVPGGISVDDFVERTLSDIDKYVASLPIMGSGGGTGHSAVIGIPLTIEVEVQPAFARYDRCLKTQVSSSNVTIDTVVAKFKEAMAVCASVRQLAVTDAEKALIAKGWDEATRKRVASGPFDKVDESWLVMGLQYRQAMIEYLTEAAREATSKKPR